MWSAGAFYLSPIISLSLCLSVSLSRSISLSLSLSLPPSLCLSFSPFLSLSYSVSLSPFLSLYSVLTLSLERVQQPAQALDHAPLASVGQPVPTSVINLRNGRRWRLIIGGENFAARALATTPQEGIARKSPIRELPIHIPAARFESPHSS
jgi:hypothetical protein